MKRDEVKYIRDAAKGQYKKGTECYICGEKEELQFHHFYSMVPLWDLWKRKNKVVISDEADIIKHRDEFIKDKHKEVYDETVTLCKFHHMQKLHKLYGKCPPLGTAMKQKRWCEKMRQKENINAKI